MLSFVSIPGHPRRRPKRLRLRSKAWRAVSESLIQLHVFKQTAEMLCGIHFQVLVASSPDDRQIQFRNYVPRTCCPQMKCWQRRSILKVTFCGAGFCYRICLCAFLEARTPGFLSHEEWHSWCSPCLSEACNGRLTLPRITSADIEADPVTSH